MKGENNNNMCYRLTAFTPIACRTQKQLTNKRRINY